MIVALLVIIVVILLFGAGVVKGWLANVFGAILGFAVFVGSILWIGSFLGENGAETVIYWLAGIAFVVAIMAGINRAL